MTAITAGERVSTLRGATVGEIDGRRIRGAVAIACAVVLAGLAASLFVAGARKNAQITGLRRGGVPVVVTVIGCMGLLGGSGSNAAGYTCHGRFTLQGRTEIDTIPGDEDRPPGTTVRAITLAGDPGLLATERELSMEHATPSVFLLPSCIVAVLAVAAAVVLGRRRRVSRRMRGGC